MSPPPPRAISVLRLLAVVGATGMVLGTVAYWVSAAREDTQLDEVMAQQALNTFAPGKRLSLDVTAPPAAALEGLPEYPGAMPRRVAEKMSGQGGQMAVAWFSTSDSVDQVLSFYERAFARAGHVYAVHRFNARTGYAGWMQPDRAGAYADAGLAMLDGVMHVASVLREGHTTVVLLSAARPTSLMGDNARMPAGLTLPPWADPPQVFDIGEGALSQATVFSEVKGHAAEEVDQWLRTHLKQQGWEIADHASGEKRTALDFRRVHERLSVVLTPSEEKVVVMLQYANQPTSLTEGL